MQPDAAAVRAGVRHIAHDTIGSTNAEALARARSGERGPLWITARAQTAGKGRRGAPWVSEPGNLYATLLLTDLTPAADLPQLCFVAVLAAHDAVAQVGAVNAHALTIKWPNDLLLFGRKIGGILIEGWAGGGPAAVAIGIGVNCRHHPLDTRYPATDLVAEGFPMTAEDLFSALTRTMLARLDQWRHGVDFALTRKDWLARASGIGAEIEVRSARRTLRGTFQDIDDGGHLVLRTAGGELELIAAGEIAAIAGGGTA